MPSSLLIPYSLIGAEYELRQWQGPKERRNGLGDEDCGISRASTSAHRKFVSRTRQKICSATRLNGIGATFWRRRCITRMNDQS